MLPVCSSLSSAPAVLITGLPSKALETLCDFFTPFLPRGLALVAYCIRHHPCAHQRQHGALGKTDLGSAGQPGHILYYLRLNI